MSNLPLSGILVLDASRMLPGAVLARMLTDMGARVVKVEDPAGGDPFRSAPPVIGGIGAGFAAFYRGAESVALDLREPRDAAALRKLVKHADVFVESFRPGTLEKWDLGRDRLRALNPSLVSCSLSGYGQKGEWAPRVGHDLNFTAQSGLLSLLPADSAPDGTIPRIQVADVASGMLACSAIVAALYAREKTGIGADLDQPLAFGPLPFLTWALAEAAGAPTGANSGPTQASANANAGADAGVNAGANAGVFPRGMLDLHLAGRSPCYGVYACQDGTRIALGALEPKFWMTLIDALDQPDLAGDALDTGERGQQARSRLAAVFASKPRDHWLDLARQRNLPLTAVNDIGGSRRDPFFGDRSRQEAGGLPGSYFNDWSGGKDKAAPKLGEHTAKVLAEVGYVLESSGNAARA